VADDGWAHTGLEVLHTADFEGVRLKRPGVYAVCFAATWCPPTQRFVPQFVARKGSAPASFAMADITDMEDPLWDSFHIDITPTMAVFQDGKVVGRFDGRPALALDERDLDKLTRLVKRLAAP
jgi:thioredoxin-like negative regulator of GroEL